jgi:enolase
MVQVKSVTAKSLINSRKEKTILISIKTNVGVFSASAPSGKSTGKFESKPYKKNLETDIAKIKEFSGYFSDESIEKFDDLRRIEDTVEGHIGANSLFAFEAAILKALAKEMKMQVWELIDPLQKNMPKLVGNCIGGGKHSMNEEQKLPDFQEFLLIPSQGLVKDAFETNKKTKRDLEIDLKKRDKEFSGKKNEENAWITSLNEKEVLDILKNKNIPLGVDIASSEFYSRKKYHYKNPMLKRTDKEQIDYLSNLIKNFNLFYIEDPFGEECFEEFSKLLEKFPNSLIVGDDLTVTNSKRLEKAIKLKSINAIIVKPNQTGSLMEVKKVCELAKKNNIKIIFSHRSGETKENILADLAFGFSADFFKCGIDGPEREAKIKRLIEIEKSLK